MLCTYRSSAQAARLSWIDEERRHDAAVAPETVVSKALFDMHTVTIQDLLAFELLPNFDEVEAMNKFVIPGPDDTRPILFIRYDLNYNIKTGKKSIKQVFFQNLILRFRFC